MKPAPPVTSVRMSGTLGADHDQAPSASVGRVFPAPDGARAALRLMDDPVRVISTAQVGITAIGILLAALAEPTMRNSIGDGLPSWLTFVIAVSLITYLSLVLGELMPRALTLDRAETLAVLVARQATPPPPSIS